MKRILLFLLTNVVMIITLGIVASVLCVLMGTTMAQVVGDRYSHLAIYALVYGFLGSVISLLMSKTMAKMSCRAKTIDGSEGDAELWLVRTVRELAERANVKMPEVAIYPGPANAFATGAFRNHALVAVSSDIMRQMTKEELKAVLGHEMSHVANGDMVTLALVQGVLNAFVIFLSHVLASIIANAGKGRNSRRGGNYFLARILQIPLGFASMLVVYAFSRHREYAADAGSARLLGTQMPMIAALRRLGNLQPGSLPDSLRAFGIASGGKTSMLSTHPALEDRIEALQKWVPCA